MIPKQTVVGCARRSRADVARRDRHRARRPIALIPYAELLAQALLIGGALLAEGLLPGDRVALVAPEVGSFVPAFFGIGAAGLRAGAARARRPRPATCRRSRARRDTCWPPAARRLS